MTTEVRLQINEKIKGSSLSVPQQEALMELFDIMELQDAAFERLAASIQSLAAVVKEIIEKHEAKGCV